MGPGIKAQNTPSATPEDTERRFRCQRLGSFILGPSHDNQRFSVIVWGWGIYFLKIFFNAEHYLKVKAHLLCR